MPFYEFYCRECHMIFSFYSKSVNTEKRPLCPRCEKIRLERRMSVFATVRERGEEDDMTMPDMDEAKMEKAMGLLAREAEHMDENDPKQAADLMRKLTDMTGMNLGPGMEEALKRMEAGEDPEQIEADMGDLLEGEDPFQIRDKTARVRNQRPPAKDDKLYDL